MENVFQARKALAWALLQRGAVPSDPTVMFYDVDGEDLQSGDVVLEEGGLPSSRT